MPDFLTATIDETGTRLAYLDSGPLLNESYATIVIVHGFAYHAQIFSKTLPLASSYNLHIIVFNRRDYVGSMPFSPSELSQIVSSNGESDEMRSSFLQARSLEVARFLVYVVWHLQIPPAVKDDHGKGKWKSGLALKGWSLGNMFTMSFLGNLSAYPKDVTDALSPYLKKLIIYDLDHSTLGYPKLEGGYVFYNDPDVSQEKMWEHISTWLSSYYAHPYYTSPSSQGKDKNEKSHRSLLQRIPTPEQAYRPSTQLTLTPDEAGHCVDPAPVARSDGPFVALVKKETLYEQTKHRLLLGCNPDYDSKADQGSTTATTIPLSFFPEVEVLALYCRASIWNTTWCTWQLEEDLEEVESRRPYTSSDAFPSR